MKRKYNYAVFIGRCQPPHQEHINQIRRGLQLADTVIVILGSHRSARNPRNPFTFDERAEMIQECLTQEEWERVEVGAVRDYHYNNIAWFTDLYNTVERIIEDDVHDHYPEETPEQKVKDPKICLLGTQKDASSWYLEVAGGRWTPEFGGMYQELVNATDIRDAYFGGISVANLPDYSPTELRTWLANFKKRNEYKQLQQEFLYLNNYKKMWASAPYPVTFVTTDAVVIQNAHVLVIRRKFNPGKGNLALPGGFLKSALGIKASMLTELREETRIKLKGGRDLLEKSIKEYHVFDNPARSLRGRTLSHAYLIQLPDGPELPKVKGDDDASGAFWMPIADIRRYEDEFFEDHCSIIEFFSRRL